MERIKTFVNGGRFYPADINAIQDRAAEMLEGTAAAIPSSHFAGRFYRTTDTNQLFLDSGMAWNAVGNQGYQDLLQAGVIASTDWSFTANINSGTGALGSTGTTGGTAWLPDPVISGALMRSVTTPATLSGLAPTPPLTTKYVSVGFELAPSIWGGAATVSVKTGIEKNTEAEAIAAPAATTAGKIKIRDVVIKNTAGVYSIAAPRDRRPWARGFLASRALASSFEATTATAVPELTIRAECTGVPIQATIAGTGVLIGTGPTSQVSASVLKDGVGVSPSVVFEPGSTVTCDTPLNLSLLMSVTAGSHLFAVQLNNGGKAEKVFLSEGSQLIIREHVQGNVNNGTS